MKALIISDIHANIYALEAIWKAESDSEIVYCAGDLVDYGPFPREVLAWVRERRVVIVQGNHDRAVAKAYRSGEELWSIPNEELKWRHHNARLLSEEDVSFLESLPLSVSFMMDGAAYSMQHMYIDYDTIVSLPQFETYWEQQTSGDLRDSANRRLIFGHTHRRCIHYLGDRDLWLNPGSISYRRKDDPTKVAHYMTITDGRIEMKSLSYDRSPLYKAVLGTPLSAPETETAIRFFS